MLRWIKNLFLPRVGGYRPCWLKEQIKKRK